MKEVPLAEFKAHCSRYVEEVAEEEIVITKHGKPIAHLSAARPTGDLWHLRGALKGQLIVDDDDDFFSTGIKWDAES